MRISAEKLKEILESYGKWWRDEEGGERAYLQGADLPNGIYQVVGCGCANRCTTYDSINNRVICGCWNDGDGNHLESFEQRVEDIYGFHGKTPNAELYAEYRAAINFFKTVIKVENG